MHTPPTTKQIQAHLDEVNFVYRQLPSALQRVEAITPAQQWRSFFHKQASVLRDHQQSLRTTVEAWGQRLRPCACEDVTKRLNELRYALAARPDTPVLERTVHGVLTDLRMLVVQHLEDAAQLATRLGELDLSRDLLKLLNSERAQTRMHEDPWRK